MKCNCIRLRSVFKQHQEYFLSQRMCSRQTFVQKVFEMYKNQITVTKDLVLQPQCSTKSRICRSRSLNAHSVFRPSSPPPLDIMCTNITFPPKAGLTEQAKMQLCLLAGEQTTDTSHQVLELLICTSKIHYERKRLVSLNTASNYAK